MKKNRVLILVLILCLGLTSMSYADYALEEALLKSKWSGTKSSITIIVDQPVKKTRNAVSEYPGVNVGHTMIRIEKKTPTGIGSYVSYFGFYPKDGVDKKNILFSKSTPGKVYWESEVQHKWNIARTYEITPEKAQAVMNWAGSYSTNYNIETNNCTTFAYDALIKAGVSKNSTGLSKNSWTIPASWKKEVPVFRFWYGYTPGDAGEDLRGKANVFTN